LIALKAVHAKKKNEFEKASSKKLGMDNQREWVPRNAFLRNYRDIPQRRNGYDKETRRVRGGG
jgi:hypothetical protein